MDARGSAVVAAHRMAGVGGPSRASAGNAGLDKCDHIIAHLWPEVVLADEFEGLRLARMAREPVVMTSLEDAGPQVSVVRYVYCTIMKEEPVSERDHLFSGSGM